MDWSLCLILAGVSFELFLEIIGSLWAAFPFIWIWLALLPFALVEAVKLLLRVWITPEPDAGTAKNLRPERCYRTLLLLNVAVAVLAVAGARAYKADYQFKYRLLQSTATVTDRFSR